MANQPAPAPLITQTARPALPTRDIGGALLAASIALPTTWAVTGWALNKLALTAGGGMGHYSAHWCSWAKTAGWAVTGGKLWSSDASQYWRHVDAQPHGWQVDAIAGASFLIALSLAGWLVWRLARPTDPHVHVRGRQRLDGKQATNRAVVISKEKAAISGEGIKIHPNLTLANHQVLQSLMLMGCQGGGKTQILWRVLLALLAERKKYKAVIFDLAKGDFTQSTPDVDRLFALGDHRSSVWAIWRDVKTLPDAESCARGIVPDGGKDPMWSNASRAVLVAIFMKLMNECGEKWGWKELGELAYLPIEELKEIAALHYPPALSAVADAESKTSQSILINLHAFLAPLYRFYLEWRDLPANFKNGKPRTFSWIEWLNDDDHEDRVIILQSNSKDKTAAAALIRAMMELQVSHIASLDFAESKTRKIGYFLDEFPQIGRLECLATILEIGRSKGCFVAALAFQTIIQIRQIYQEGEDEKWISMLGVRIFGQIKGNSSADFVLRQIGNREVERPTESITSAQGGGSRSSSYQRSEMAVMTADELEDLGPQQGGVRGIVLGHGKDVLTLDWPYYTPPNLRPVKVPTCKQQHAGIAAEMAKTLERLEGSGSSNGADDGSIGMPIPPTTATMADPEHNSSTGAVSNDSSMPKLPNEGSQALAFLDGLTNDDSSTGTADSDIAMPELGDSENAVINEVTQHLASESLGEALGVSPEIIGLGLEVLDNISGSSNGEAHGDIGMPILAQSAPGNGYEKIRVGRYKMSKRRREDDLWK